MHAKPGGGSAGGFWTGTPRKWVNRHSHGHTTKFDSSSTSKLSNYKVQSVYEQDVRTSYNQIRWISTTTMSLIWNVAVLNNWMRKLLDAPLSFVFSQANRFVHQDISQRHSLAFLTVGGKTLFQPVVYLLFWDALISLYHGCFTLGGEPNIPAHCRASEQNVFVTNGSAKPTLATTLPVKERHTSLLNPP